MIQTFRPSDAAVRGIKFASMATLGGSLMTSCVDSSGNIAGGYQSSSADTETSAMPYRQQAKHLPPQVTALPKPTEKAPAFERGYGGGCPELMVRIENYCIDRFEAFVVELNGGKELPHLHSVHPADTNLRAKVALDAYPQGSISRPQSLEACRNAGKRLCTRLEWRKACRGVMNFKYPYGNDEEPGKCNTRKLHLVTMFYGTDPMKWGDGMNDPLLNMIKGYLEKGGFKSDCVSSYGTYDMVGNLHEWVEDLVDESMASMKSNGKRSHALLKTEPGNGIFMGGFFSTANQNGEGCEYMTTAHHQGHYDYSTGFRCCKDADQDGK